MHFWSIRGSPELRGDSWGSGGAQQGPCTPRAAGSLWGVGEKGTRWGGSKCRDIPAVSCHLGDLGALGGTCPPLSPMSRPHPSPKQGVQGGVRGCTHSRVWGLGGPGGFYPAPGGPGGHAQTWGAAQVETDSMLRSFTKPHVTLGECGRRGGAEEEQGGLYPPGSLYQGVPHPENPLR